jgi:hypothetical protein
MTNSIGEPSSTSIPSTLPPPHSSSSPNRIEVVLPQSDGVHSFASPCSSDIYVHRRFRCGLGSNGGQRFRSRSLDSGPALMAYQFEGIVHGPGGDLIQPITRCKPYGGFTVGQQDCNSVYSETGRFALSRSTGRNKETFVNNVKTKHTHRTLFHSGEVQFPGRRSVSPGSYPRLAPSPFSDGVSLSTLGGAKHRFVCDPQIESCAALCDPESPGQQGGIHRCLLKKVGFQASVGLPAPASTSSSIASLERRPGLICNSSSSVAEGLLVSRLEGAGNSPPNNGSRPQIASDRSSNGLLSGNDRGHDIGNLANTGWVNQVEGWSESDKRVLTAAWRPSTRSTYQKPWARWLSWSSTNAVDPRNPSPHHLARFLAYLFHTEKLSLSTILLHRSVVVTLSNPDSSMNLSSHPVVTKMIKGISASQVQRSTRSIWDVSTLLNWMENNSPSSSSFFELSRYLALLLLLASGRRVHDLTLLQCDSEHLPQILLCFGLALGPSLTLGPFNKPVGVSR